VPEILNFRNISESSCQNN